MARGDAEEARWETEMKNFQAKIDANHASQEKPKEPKVVVHRARFPSLPFPVRMMGESEEQPSFIFKYGVLAKWYVKEEVTGVCSPTPSHTESLEEIHLFEEDDDDIGF